jgi:hypothetical protein
MVKCLESLLTLYRTLIALCGLLIAVGASYHPAVAGNPTPEEMKAFQEKLDFFGFKLSAYGICNFGSIVVIFLLLMMINLTRTGRNLPSPKEPADAGFWYGQFLGLLAPVPIATLIVLPLAAVGEAQSALYQIPPNVIGGYFDRYEQQFVIFVAVQLLCSLWLWGESVFSAYKWNKQMKAPPAPAPAAPFWPLLYPPSPLVRTPNWGANYPRRPQ